MDNSLDNNLPSVDDVEKTEVRVMDEHQISLLEEKLIVKRRKHKVGEVIVRKEIETRTIHLPIRREKLIIEKVGVTNEHLTEIDLGEGEVNGVRFGELDNTSDNTNDIYLSQSKFVSVETAQQLLAEVNNRFDSLNIKVRLEIVSSSSDSQAAYQDICDRY